MGNKLLRSSVDPAAAKKEDDRGALVRALLVRRKEAMQVKSCIVSAFVQVFCRITEVKVRVCSFGFACLEGPTGQDQDGHGNVIA